MNKADEILRKVNAARVKAGLGPIDAGFDYGETIKKIMQKTECTQEGIGISIGLSGQQVGKIIKGTSLPNHLSGELLCGLWKDALNDPDLDDLPMRPRQTVGADSLIPPKRERIID